MSTAVPGGEDMEMDNLNQLVQGLQMVLELQGLLSQLWENHDHQTEIFAEIERLRGWTCLACVSRDFPTDN